MTPFNTSRLEDILRQLQPKTAFQVDALQKEMLRMENKAEIYKKRPKIPGE